MQTILKIILYSGLLFTLSTQCSELVIGFNAPISVRHATHKDLPNIFNLLQDNDKNNAPQDSAKDIFKPVWRTDFTTMDEDIIEAKNRHKNSIKDFIERQAQEEEYGVLLGYALESDPNDETKPAEEKTLAGYCMFKKENQATILINNVFIHPRCRKIGLATILIHNALSVWETVTQCKFHLLTGLDSLNQMLGKKKNCKQTNTVSIDGITLKIDTNPNASKTHYEYIYTITKQ